MRRTEREITDTEEMLRVLEKCDTLSIGFNGQDYPYVVPVSFGVVRQNDSVIIYFHGAKQGKKVDMIADNPKVCIEGHVFYKVEPTEHGITTRYESIIGFGVVESAEEDEIIPGLESITGHYHYSDYPIGKCKGLPMTNVYKVTISKLTGKRNLAEQIPTE
ncbi:MAG: pyridoxamine 5'-phosphate oxidase family protein [Lachnospiraceae bacterium]|nr:pyridoxamine 5'-phosphate oxidase family protein [Lachnospiraceae bacterium]